MKKEKLLEILHFSDIHPYDIQKIIDNFDNQQQEIDRLNKIIEEIEKLFDNDITDEITKYLPSKYINDYNAMYKACGLFLKDKLQRLKEEGK